MKRHLSARITEGAMYGAPVPGWPNRGPFRVLRDAFRRLVHGREAPSRDDAEDRPDDPKSEADD